MMKFTQLEDIDPQASLTIFQILLYIEERNKEYGELLIDISFALCEKVGKIDQVYMISIYNILAICILLLYMRECKTFLLDIIYM